MARVQPFTMRILAIALFLLAFTFSVGAQSPNAACLGCHGTPDIQSMTTKKGNFFVDPAKHAGSVHGPLGCTTCHTTISEYPHPKRIPKVDCSSCHGETPEQVARSAHAALGSQACASCHGDIHTTKRAAMVSPQQCTTCHADQVRDYKSSVHAQMRANGSGDAPNCQSCHGPTHQVVPSRDATSKTAKQNLPDTCGACHANPDFLARHKIPFARPVEAYRLSVHGRAVAAGNPSAPSCSDCHASHAVLPARDQRSKINHWNVPATCGSCHSEIRKVYADSVHGTAVARGVRGAPVCTDCHGEHTILAPTEPQSLVNPARVSSVTCGRCHGDERLAARYNLPTDKVPAFQDSFHGLAARAGSQTVANCASCHGVHNILPSSDARSTIHPANLAGTCGSCHPGAGQRFTIGPVHVRPATASEHPSVRWIRVAYWIIIPFTIGFMLFHHVIDFFRKLIHRGARIDTGEELPRMNLHFRIAHWGVIVSFLTLVATGFALKFPDASWAAPLLHWESQFALRGTIHRTAGVVLVAALIYHAIHLLVRRRDRVLLSYMRPGIEDVKQLTGVIRYNLGLAQEKPPFGPINYAEKLEYLAFMWGTVVMAVSGFLLWFNNFTLRYFPTWVADAATAIHYYEAILASLSILIWHFYIVIFDPDVYPMDKAWLTGKTSADHLRHTRPAYYAELLEKKREREERAEIAAKEAAAREAAAKEAARAIVENSATPANPNPESAAPSANAKESSPPPQEKK